MNEFLYVFGSENYLVCKEIEITEFDEVNCRIKAKGYASRRHALIVSGCYAIVIG